MIIALTTQSHEFYKTKVVAEPDDKAVVLAILEDTKGNHRFLVGYNREEEFNYLAELSHRNMLRGDAWYQSRVALERCYSRVRDYIGPDQVDEIVGKMYLEENDKMLKEAEEKKDAP